MSFKDRKGTFSFDEATAGRGILPQLNEWANGPMVQFQVERIGGQDHVPDFKATPIYNGEVLEDCICVGPSKKKAIERAEAAVIETGRQTRATLTWKVVRTGGEAHRPSFTAYPIWNDEHLTEYTGIANSKKEAMEDAAAAMAASGHC
ncbi:unnamed protein product [Somion occarium]|uniref:DRBM domain-containing protein n=1 Tax=Somion occarium TaxID=3059160 RepID=A0ABP1CFI8_9APHY